MPGMTSTPKKGSWDFEPIKLSQQKRRGVHKNPVAQYSGWMGSNSHAPCGLVNCKVVGPSGPSLTNRMSELLTYGSVGGVGGNPGPYPALDAAMTLLLQSGRPRCRASERGRSAVQKSRDL